MKIKIGILNSKGGCGKTTIAINLSVAISHQMIKTVLIDADPNQGALFWFKKRNKNQFTIYLKTEFDDIYYFNFKNGIMKCYSSNDDFMNIIKLNNLINLFSINNGIS